MERKLSQPIAVNGVLALAAYLLNERYSYFPKETFAIQLVESVSCSVLRGVSHHYHLDEKCLYEKEVYYLGHALIVGMTGCMGKMSVQTAFLSAALLSGGQVISHSLFRASTSNAPPQKTPEELRKVIDDLQKEYEIHEEKDNPPGGYVINLFKGDKSFTLSPRGNRNKGERLSGTPASHPGNCNLCQAESIQV